MPLSSDAFLFVRFHGHVQLRIPIAATNLATEPTPDFGRTKLSPAALEEFLSLVQEDMPCREPARSGKGSRHP